MGLAESVPLLSLSMEPVPLVNESEANPNKYRDQWIGQRSGKESEQSRHRQDDRPRGEGDASFKRLQRSAIGESCAYRIADTNGSCRRSSCAS